MLLVFWDFFQDSYFLVFLLVFFFRCSLKMFSGVFVSGVFLVLRTVWMIFGGDFFLSS